jgi:hypothetical protein
MYAKLRTMSVQMRLVDENGSKKQMFNTTTQNGSIGGTSVNYGANADRRELHARL